MKPKLFAFLTASLALLAAGAAAQDAAEIQPASETSRFIFSTLLSLASAAATLLLLAGLAAREAGLVQAKNAGAAGVKILVLGSVCALASWLVGYNLAFSVEPGGFLGDFSVWTPDDSDPAELGRAAASRWLFMASAGAVAAASISGALAERLKFWPLAIFAAGFAAIIFPVAAGWDWGGGYLEARWRFSDFAGATLVHSSAGWAALAGAVIIGPRMARYHGGEPAPWTASSPALAALGGLFIWLGWFGLVGGAQLALSSALDAVALTRALVNSQLAASAGVVVAAALTSIIYQKVELPIVVNGAIGGLVAISGGPIEPALWQAVVIGAFSGVIVTVTGPLLDRFRIDDVVGAVPAHLLCGVWGTMIVPWTNESADYLGQSAGVVIVGAFSLSMSILFWTFLRYTVGVRATPSREAGGLDAAELGLESAPRFPRF